MSSPHLKCKELSKRFDKKIVLNGLDLEVNREEIVSILGPSGCGKSTLLRLIAGFNSPDSGTITIDNKVIFNQSKNIEPQHRKVGFVFQDLALFPHLSVEKNITFGLQKNDQTERLNDMLTLLEISGIKDKYPSEISGGQQQRVAIARALAPKPKLLLLDEPFSSLDSDLKERILKDFKKIIKGEGITTLLVTHSKDEAITLSDKWGHLKEGRKIEWQ
ncbi:ABC transporter [Candidatus Marinamargulisbacteria bacterium SCGC AAA071-K20]|nr:ABC transporter [Candidatus Marinamargulisbacteria bacterium SCGC AAA071-K20]